MLKVVGLINIKIKMKEKSGEFAQEFLITADNCLFCLLALDFMIYQKCILSIGEQYSTKQRSALPISAQTTTGVRTFAIARADTKNRNPHQG